MNRWKGWLTLVLGMVLSVHAVAIAESSEKKDDSNAATAIEAPAAEGLQKFATSLQAEKGFAVDVALDMLYEEDGMKQEFSSESTFAIRKPRQLAITLRRGKVGSTIVCDGTNIVSYIPMMNKYATEEAPEDVEALFEEVGQGMFSGFPILRVFLSKDPYAALMEDILFARVIGEETVDDTPYIRLRLGQKELDWDIWITKGEAPRLRRVVPDMSRLIREAAAAQGGPMPDFSKIRYEIQLDFTRWRGNDELKDEEFIFAPPPGAELIDPLSLEGSDDEEHALQGKPAPTFKAPMLDGSPFDLAAHKGNVVLLDFWASWCGPCRQALPIIAETVRSVKDVVFLAVNQGEEKEGIMTFLKEQNLELPVALDPRGEVGRLYEVSGIPQTVLIDRSGKVAAVHIGLLPNLKETLTRELQELIEKPAP